MEVEPTPGLPLEIPEAQPPTEPTPPRLSNRLVPRVGAEYAFGLGKRTELSLRGGYAFEKSPVPDQRGQTNFVDTDRHLVSAGSGLLWKRPSPLIGGDLSFDIHAQWSILVTRVTLKDSAADFVGDYRAGGDIFNIGGTFSVRFR
jgi:long-chain fatty acid transport protein